MDDCDHLVLRGLEEGVLDVAVDDVHLLVGAARAVPEPVGVGLQGAAHLLAAATEGGADPDVGEALHTALGKQKLLLHHLRSGFDRYEESILLHPNVRVLKGKTLSTI